MVTMRMLIMMKIMKIMTMMTIQNTCTYRTRPTVPGTLSYIVILRSPRWWPWGCSSWWKWRRSNAKWGSQGHIVTFFGKRCQRFDNQRVIWSHLKDSEVAESTRVEVFQVSPHLILRSCQSKTFLCVCNIIFNSCFRNGIDKHSTWTGCHSEWLTSDKK